MEREISNAASAEAQLLNNEQTFQAPSDMAIGRRIYLVRGGQVFQSRSQFVTLNDDENMWSQFVTTSLEKRPNSADPTDYLKRMRKRDPELGIYIGTNCPQVKMTIHDLYV